MDIDDLVSTKFKQFFLDYSTNGIRAYGRKKSVSVLEATYYLIPQKHSVKWVDSLLCFPSNIKLAKIHF